MTRIYNKSRLKETRRHLRREQTYTEKIAWMVLRNRSLLDCKFRRQYSVDRYVIDFFSPELKLAIELDGSVHDSAEQKARDEVRQKFLENLGITFLRFRNEVFINNGDYALNEIKRTIERIRKNGPHPPRTAGHLLLGKEKEF